MAASAGPADTNSIGRDRGRDFGRGPGVVSGAVLRAIRDSLGLTQPDLAEALGVSEIVVRSWESGRRPMANMKVADLHRHRHMLALLGAERRSLALIDHAIEVDLLWHEITRDGVPPQHHPLATFVPTRTVTELMAWPLTGQPPRQLDTGQRPHLLASGEQEALAAWLRHATEHAAADEAGAMLLRQVGFLLARHPGSQAWLQDIAIRTRLSTSDLRKWTPEWPVNRSHAVSEALRGNPEPLSRFIVEGLASDQNITANLNYWAYWTGELADVPWTSDSQMITTDLHSWSGERLADSLIDSLASAPYRDLCAHSLWALLNAKPHLIRGGPRRSRLLRRIEELLSTPAALNPTSRDRLGQVAYLVRSAA